MCKNNLKEILLSHYKNTYFEKLNDIQKNQGNRFLISPCPDTADNVQLLFLNLNPQKKKDGEDENIHCMEDTKFDYWFDEGWPKSKHFRNLFYVIGKKLEDPKWSYEGKHERIDWDNLTSKKIYSKKILSAYAYPLRTHDEDALKEMTRIMKDDIKEEIEEEIEKEIKKKMENETEEKIKEKIKKEIKKEMKKDQTKRIKKMLESKLDWAPVLLAEELWNKIIGLLPKPLKIVVTGNTPYDMICRMLEAETTKYFKLKWGSNLSLKYAETNNEKNIKILCFPQVSHFPLISSKKLTNDDAKTIDDAFDYLLK